VEVAPAALGHDADLAAGGAAVLRGEAGGEDLHLLDGVDVRQADVGPRRARAQAGDAVVGQDVLVGPTPVDHPPAVAEVGGVEATEVASPHSRLQHRQAQRVAAIQHQVLDLAGLDEAADLGGVRLDRGGLGHDRHLLRDQARLQHHVQGDLGGGVELDAGLGVPLEALQLDADVVDSWQERDGDVVALRVRRECTFDPGGDVHDRDDRPRDDTPLLVLDEAGHLAPVDLGPGRRGEEGEQEGRDRRQEQKTVSPAPRRRCVSHGCPLRMS
jgi:hypothetical protein